MPGFKADPDGKPLIARTAESLYAYGHLIRSTEELILDLFGRGLVSGTTHTCLGQELCQMAVVRALTHPKDSVLSNHRNHGHFLTYSGDFEGLVAEIMGRASGVCGGRGGSQHLAYRHFHSNGVQGGMTGIGAGLGLARKLAGEGGIVAVIIGDGTLGQGLLYESLNLASSWELPVLFVVENNGIAQTTYTAQTTGGTIGERGAAFGLSTWQLADDDPQLFEKVEEVVRVVRSTCRPGFLTLDTMRLGPHSKGDDLRPAAEMEAIRIRDPLTKLGQRLSADAREQIERRNRAFVEDVERRAIASVPARLDVVPSHIFGHCVSENVATPMTHYPANRAEDINVRPALNNALRYLLESSDKTLLLGEDLHDPYGGAFKVAAGLSTDFPGRVISTPISEAGITGAAIGLAVAGYKPIVEIMFADFLTLCMDQIYNHAVKFPGVFPGTKVPLVVRTPCGGRRGYGPTHSQSPENVFTSVPGLTVVYGSHRHDLGSLLITATERWDYPTLFLEHKLLYGESQDAAEFVALSGDPQDVAADLFPTMVRRRVDPDVTILTYGGMLPVVERVAGYLEAEEEISVDILVPSLLSPFPKHSVVSYLQSHPRLAIVEESHHQFGVGSEIMANLLEARYAGQAIRIGTPPLPIFSARSLERQIIPSEDRIADDILKMF